MEIFVKDYSTAELFTLVSAKLAKYNVPADIICAIVHNMIVHNMVVDKQNQTYPVNMLDFCSWFTFDSVPEGFDFWDRFAAEHDFWEVAV